MKKLFSIFIGILILGLSQFSFATNSNDIDLIKEFSKITWKIVVETEFEGPYGKKFERVNTGSCFFINGKIVTSNHIIEQKTTAEYSDIKINLKQLSQKIYIIHKNYPKKIFLLSIVQLYKINDIALLELKNQSDYKVLEEEIKISKTIELNYPEVGEQVYILGYPGVFPLVLSSGLVSSTDFTPPFDTFLIYGVVQSGNSGGPVFIIENNKVVVLGVVSATTNYSEESDIPTHFGLIKIIPSWIIY